ncbi:UPF0171-domain-containing protein [Patellaria atrata CBS 101060]|uniref:Nitrogen permease regulator 3 n=1 Tax=Patellaria atrata CBS 101060 TaxID=1346257 RepID=A0A9P4SHB3_9PEZI|nr:UPF0171-domain-containing protein [Patellaria atrata CBS 101060]
MASLSWSISPTTFNHPPNPSLVAIILVAKSRAGPHFVFHYPPYPKSGSLPPSNPSWYGTTSTKGDTSSESSSGSSGSSDDEESGDRSSRAGSRVTSRGTSGKHEPGLRGTGLREYEDIDEVDREEEDFQEDGSRPLNGASRRPPENDWEEVLGYATGGLENLLCPQPGLNKRRFEVALDILIFLGSPRFVRDDGTWKKRRRRRWSGGNGNNELANVNHSENLDYEAADNQTRNSRISSMNEQDPTFVHPEGFEPGYGHGMLSEVASEAGSEPKSDSTGSMEDEMTLFNVLFVLDPPVNQHILRIKELYDNVAKKFSKALKHEQARSNYVWEECRKILALKAKAKENKTPMSILWPTIMFKSSLARSIAIIYDAISDSKIAHVNLNSSVDTSFQIPQAIFTPYAPTPIHPQQPGLWLTTANIVDDEDSISIMSPHSALLLLEDSEILLKEIESETRERSAPLAFFIRNLTPTKSLQKLSVTCSITMQDVQVLSNHLIYWRRARAIPPLNPRDTYIVSPNADMRALHNATRAFSIRFPSLPPLPKMLNMLSGQTRPFGQLMPSKDHRIAYMEILAWLMRGGWVTQLRTFAWLRIPAKVKKQVADNIEREERHRAKLATVQETNAGSDHAGHAGDEKSPSSLLTRLTLAENSENTDFQPRLTITSPLLRAYRSPNRPGSDTGSEASNVTTIPPLTEQKYPPSESDVSSSDWNRNNNFEYLRYKSFVRDSLIFSPTKANAEESAWIEHICGSFTDSELREMWPHLLQYLDGKHALEEIALREGVKRKRIARLVGLLREGNWLVVARHW